MKNLIITGGGTAGHCTPCITLLPHLEKLFDNVYYVGSENGIERQIVAKTHIKYYKITTVKLKRGLHADNLAIPFKLIQGVNEAKELLAKTGATAVFSKGGYVSLPVSIAARLMGIPLVLHESDLTPGLANKIAAKGARQVLTTFEQTAKELPRGRYVGPIVNPKLFTASRISARQRYGFTGNKKVLLVVGGSSGSTAINCVLRDLLPFILQKWDVLHLCGRGNLSPTITAKGYVQIEFEGEMEYAYSACDYAVSRAGSNCMFELLAMQIPTLLIPLPKGASRGDQVENARYACKMGVARCLMQSDELKERFLPALNNLVECTPYLQRNIKRLKFTPPERVAQIIYDTVK